MEQKEPFSCLFQSVTLENTRLSAAKKRETGNKMNDHAQNAHPTHRTPSIHGNRYQEVLSSKP
ncbi:MAG: hypothetical protein HQL87_14805 [Magnetococcales bacterium]|nr:hypothetical protein [Magnetococcales bacterium]